MTDSFDDKLNYIYENLKSREFNCDYTVSEWADIWLKEFKRNTIKDSSFDKYLRTMKHIKRIFGDLKISSLDVVDCQRKINSISKPSVKDDCYQLLYQMLDKAVKCRNIDFNVFSAIEIKKHQKEHGKAFTQAEKATFIKACECNSRGLAFLICLCCGLRRGELLALTINDIDFDKKELSISKQFSEGKITAPKSSSSIRTIPINDFLYQQLLLANLPKKGRLFPIGETTLREHFQRILTNCGLNGQGFTIHSLRHTFITNCAEIGIARHVTQKWAGHSTSDITDNIYTHVNGDFEINEREKLNKEVYITINQNHTVRT